MWPRSRPSSGPGWTCSATTGAISRLSTCAGSRKAVSCRSPQLMRDEGIRTEVQDAISDGLDGYELLITPGLPASPHRHGRQHKRACQRARRRCGPADRLVPDLAGRLLWPPHGLNPSRCPPPGSARHWSGRASWRSAPARGLAAGRLRLGRPGCRGWHAPGICPSRFRAAPAALVS